MRHSGVDVQLNLSAPMFVNAGAPLVGERTTCAIEQAAARVVLCIMVRHES
jgi:hypothetical protein